jgi:hypothetical protein
VNVISSKGLAELKGMSGSQPLGSAVLQDGEAGLSWSQVYDIIEFLGGETGIARAGHASRKQTRTVRQTANHHRVIILFNPYP